MVVDNAKLISGNSFIFVVVDKTFFDVSTLFKGWPVKIYIIFHNNLLQFFKGPSPGQLRFLFFVEGCHSNVSTSLN